MSAPAAGRFFPRVLITGTSSNARRTRDRQRRPTLENLETRTLMAVALADLSIAVRASATTVQLGESLTYTLEITNAGPSAATNLVATVILPDNVSFSGSVGVPPGLSFDGAHTVTYTLADFPAANLGLNVPIQVFTVPVTTAAAPGRATVFAYEADPTITDNTTLVPVVTVVAASADLAVTGQLISASTILDHNTFAYQLAIANAGPSLASNVKLTLPLAAGYTYVGPTDAASGFTYVNNILTYSVSSLPVTGTQPLTLRVPIRADVTGVTPVFKATVGSELPDNHISDNTFSLPTVNVTSAAASLFIHAKPLAASVHVNDPLNYVIEVSNTGQSTLTNINVSVPLPPTVHFDGGSPGIKVAHDARTNIDTVTYTVASLPVSGVFFSFFLTVHPTATGTIPAILATASSDTTSPSTATFPAVAVVPAEVAQNGPDLALSIVGPSTPIAVGDSVVFTLTIKNVGNATAQGVKLSFPVVTGLQMFFASPNLSRIPDLAAKASITFRILAVATRASTPGAPVISTAIATSRTDQLNHDHSASFRPVVVEKTRLNVSLGLLNSDLVPRTTNPIRSGDFEYYVITVSNVGLGALKFDPTTNTGGVVIRDVLPAGLDVIWARSKRVDSQGKPLSAGVDFDFISDAPISTNLGTMLPGEFRQVVIAVRARLGLFVNAIGRNRTTVDNMVNASFGPSPHDTTALAADASATLSTPLVGSGYGAGPDAFVTTLFNEILHRAPSAGELYVWSASLVYLDLKNPGGVRLDFIKQDFSDSNEPALAQTFWDAYQGERSHFRANRLPWALNAARNFADAARARADLKTEFNLSPGYSYA